MDSTNYLEETITKRIFYNEYLPLTIKYYINLGAFAYFLSALAYSLLIFINHYLIIDILLLIGFGLGTLLSKSYVFSIITIVYVIISFVIGFLEGRFAIGLLPILAVAVSCVGTFKYHKLWKLFHQDRQLFNEIAREYFAKESKQKELKKYRGK